MRIRRREKKPQTQPNPPPTADESLFGTATNVADPAPADDETLFDAGFDATEDPVQSSMAEATRVVGPHNPAPRRAPPAQPKTDPMADPPVGWLVVVRGSGKGNVLTLGNGLNIVGRSPDMRVSIDFGDLSISAANHARIVYDPRERRFLLSHGDGTNLTYLDDQLVMEPVQLDSGAEIQFGETTLRFLALCGADFDWPDLED